MIYTVTCNPALDYVLQVPRWQPGLTNRAVGEDLRYGGKGINVAVVLARLGVPVTALGFVAGFTGEELVRRVAAEGVDADFIRLEQGMTRINVKLQGEQETEVNAVGPVVGPAAQEALLRQLDRLQPGDTLVLSGSVSPGMPADSYGCILQRLQGRSVRIAVDAAGDLLRKALPHRPWLIKPNRQELEELVGSPLPDEQAIFAAAQELQRQGAQNVLVSLGGEGALLLDEHGQHHRQPALADKPVNTVGAGDSMVAGFLAGAQEGYAHALRLGSAAGSATACTAGLATKEQIMALL